MSASKKVQDEVNGVTSGGSGGEVWAEDGGPHDVDAPRESPTLGQGSEEQAKGEGQDEGPSATFIFSTPVLWEGKGLHESSAASEQQTL